MSHFGSKKPVIYVSREIERALGITPGENYLIATNRTPHAESIQAQYPKYVTLVDSPDGKILGTSQLLENPQVKNVIDSTGASIIVFKNTLRIEPFIQEAGWNFINPPAALAEKIENKISQVGWLGQFAEKLLPPHKVDLTKNISWDGNPRIIQWAHGHTGDGTFLVSSKAELASIQEKFPERMVRVSEIIHGPSFTLNIVVSKEEILVGNISYQITGLEPFTDNSFATVGNDWSVTGSLLSEAEIETIHSMARDLGKKMQSDGWQGLFGLDIMRDDEKNKIFLIEINARQPASTTYESVLQEINRKKGLLGMTTFEAHIAALSGQTVKGPLIVINDGAQVIQRLTKKVSSVAQDSITKLESANYNVVTYSNTAYNGDLLRIQCEKGIMESHNKLNPRGKEIVEAIEGISIPI